MEEQKVEVNLEERPQKERVPGRLAMAAWTDSPSGSIELFNDSNTLSGLTGSNEPDKMVLPADFHKRVQLVRYYYERDPIASTAVDKLVDIGITPIVLDRNQCSDEEYAVYSHAIDVFNNFLKSAALEYLLSGLVLPRVSWEDVPPGDIEGKVGNRRYTIPSKSWVIDPMNVELVRIPLTEVVMVIMSIPEEVRTFLHSQIIGSVKYPTGVEILREQYPEIIGAYNQNKSKVLLEDQFVIRRRSKTYDVYPTPYLLSALESLMFKRNIKKMDYSIAARVIGAIQLIKLGSDDFPLTEDDSDQLEDLENKMLWRNKIKNVDRVFQLFSNHTLDISWIYPETSAMLDDEKYKAVDRDIFFALGIPRILISGETEKAATSQAEFAMFSPAATINTLREDLLPWVEHLVNEIKIRNSFENKVRPRFEELRLFDLSKLTDLALGLYEHNALSLTSLARSLGFEFSDEVEMKAEERKLMEEFGIPEFPAMPYSPSPNQVGKENQPEEE